MNAYRVVFTRDFSTSQAQCTFEVEAKDHFEALRVAHAKAVAARIRLPKNGFWSAEVTRYRVSTSRRPRSQPPMDAALKDQITVTPQLYPVAGRTRRTSQKP
jgi:hypothetical protein